MNGTCAQHWLCCHGRLGGYLQARHFFRALIWDDKFEAVNPYSPPTDKAIWPSKSNECTNSKAEFLWAVLV